MPMATNFLIVAASCRLTAISVGDGNRDFGAGVVGEVHCVQASRGNPPSGTLASESHSGMDDVSPLAANPPTLTRLPATTADLALQAGSRSALQTCGFAG